jgi:P2-related tail formation protein
MKYLLTALPPHAGNLEKADGRTTSTLSRIGIPTDLLWERSCDA